MEKNAKQNVKTQMQIVSAYDLREGDVLYLARGDIWVRQFGEARAFTDSVAAQTALATAQSKQNDVIGAYLTDAKIGPDGTPRPVHFREAFRATGPSDRFIGKQADVASRERPHVRL